MIFLERNRLLFEKVHHVYGPHVARIASRYKNYVNPGQNLKNFRPFFECKFHHGRIGIIPINCWVPDPEIDTVIICQLRHFDHHFQRRSWKMKAVGIVVRSRRNQLNGVGSKCNQVAIILLPLVDIPGIVGICFGAIAKLVTANLGFWRRNNFQWLG